MRLGISMANVDSVLRAYHVDVDNDDIGEIAYTNNLNEMRRLTGSPLVSILSVRIGGVPYRVICAGNATERTSGRKVSALDTGGRAALRGSLVICAVSKEYGDESLVSMDDAKMGLVRDSMALVDIGSGESKYNTYVVCDLEVV